MIKNTDYYIGSSEEYRAGDSFTETAFFTDINLAKASAHKAALEAGRLFGVVYAVSHETEMVADMEVRIPQHIVRFVDWSI